MLVGGGAVLLWARGAIGAREARIAALDGQLALAEQSQGQWEDRLKAATGDALLKSQSSLLELTEAKLAPIKETLQKFEVQSKALEDRRLHEVSRDRRAAARRSPRARRSCAPRPAASSPRCAPRTSAAAGARCS